MSTEWKQVPLESNFKCRQCGSDDIEYRIVESSDGAYDDYNYHCRSCNRQWWVEGSDY
jgi:transcription elongation factor Elf1